MTSPLPPAGREPFDNAELREAIRDILTEFFSGTGVPSLAPAPVSPPRVSGAESRHPRQLVMSVFLVVLLAGATVEALSWTGLLSSSHQVPDELVGVWRTSAPLYADRAFEIGKTSVAFDTGGHSYLVYPISKVAVVRDPPASVYTIEYLTSDREAIDFSFSYVQGQEGVIRFKNQRRLVWTKARP